MSSWHSPLSHVHHHHHYRQHNLIKVLPPYRQRRIITRASSSSSSSPPSSLQMGVQIISSTASNLRPLQQCTTTTVCVLVCLCLPLYQPSASSVQSAPVMAVPLTRFFLLPSLLSCFQTVTRNGGPLCMLQQKSLILLSLFLSTIFSTCHFPSSSSCCSVSKSNSVMDP